MPTRLSAEAVDRALDEAERWEDFKDGATISLAGVSPVIAVMTSPEVGVVCSAASAAMLMLGSKKARLAKRKANDPPDEYYWVPVRARRAHFNEDAFGHGPMERATVRASYALLYALAYEGAMLRAEERATEARKQGEGEHERDRLNEARKYALRAAESNLEVSATADRLAVQLEGMDVGRSRHDLPARLATRLDLALPDRTLVILFRAGFRIEDLRVPVPSRSVPDDPIGSIAEGLRKAGAASGGFGQALMSSAEASFRADPDRW